MATTNKKIELRREVKDICDYLRSALGKRDYPGYVEENFNQNFTVRVPDLKEIEYEVDKEMVWITPLGWRVVIGYEHEPESKIWMRVLQPSGEQYRIMEPYSDFNYGVGVNWLDRDGNLP